MLAQLPKLPPWAHMLLLAVSGALSAVAVSLPDPWKGIVGGLGTTGLTVAGLLNRKEGAPNADANGPGPTSAGQ
jgi:hypothetical protein